MLGPCLNVDGKLTTKGDHTAAGELTNAATRRRPKPTKVFFHIDSDVEIKEVIEDENTGNFLLVFDEQTDEVLLKAGISYTSVENAGNNIRTELPHWNFDQVVDESQEEWNSYLSRIQIEGGTEQQQKRFYTDLWHALQGRRTISDVNGAYPDYTGEEFRVGQIPLDEVGKPAFKQYNSDSFWGAQWTIFYFMGIGIS